MTSTDVTKTLTWKHPSFLEFQNCTWFSRLK